MRVINPGDELADDEIQIIHATCLSIAGCGVLLRGVSGSGKSDLALRMIDQVGQGLGDVAVQTMLVADDRVVIKREHDRLIAKAPDTLEGLIEVRGHGVLPVAYAQSAEVKLIVDLVSPDDIERMPEAAVSSCVLLGLDLPNLKLAPFEVSAPAKLRLAVKSLSDSNIKDGLFVPFVIERS